MLTPEQAFRTGFLLRCAEEGLSDGEISARLGLVKQAVNLDALWKMPLLAGALGGTAIGGGLGLMARDTDPILPQKPPQVDALQQAETAGVLRQSAADIRRQVALLKRRRARPVSRSPFGI